MSEQDPASPVAEANVVVVHASVASIDEGRAVLDAEGQSIRIPAAMLPGDAREGTAYVLTISLAPTTKGTLQNSVEARLAALTAQTGDK